MNLRGASVALAALALALPAAGAAQGLGDAAARARQEREDQGKTTEPRSYSNNDLEGLAERTNEDSEGTVSTTGEASPTASDRRASEGSRGPTREEAVAGHLEPFEDAVTRARGRVQTLEAQIEGLQQRLNPMSTTYVYGGTGGPVGASQADEERRVRQELATAERQLEQAREAVTSAEEALAQARRAGPEQEEGY